MRQLSDQEVFDSYAPFLQEYIYKNAWESLREVQLEAGRTLFGNDHNLLLCSATASGKTEAALFPIISQMVIDPPQSVGVVYIAPLKSLINDQFARLEHLLDEADIPVYRWHGDVAQSHKEKMIRNPQGILQITPESLESMLINRSNDIPRIFGDLRYVIIDEIHTLMNCDRGNQIICQFERIQRLIQKPIRRIGLSATLGDPKRTAEWLGSGSGRENDVVQITNSKLHWRLAMEHFFIREPELVNTGEKGFGRMGMKSDHRDSDLLGLQSYSAVAGGESPMDGEVDMSPPISAMDKPIEDMSASELAALANAANGQGDSALQGTGSASMMSSGNDADEPNNAIPMVDWGYEYIYDCVKDKKSLVFSNSREETEGITSTLRQIARNRGEQDIFLIHHGNLSASIREHAELTMKDEDKLAVTCATVTMELGIDIGRLERVVQIESPNTVSHFLQRLGRSGRRGQPPEMMMIFREEEPLPNAPLPHLIPWDLLKGIAIVQLYIEEKWIEPPSIKKLPFSLLYHQTMSLLAASGELTPKRLAERMLALTPFVNVPKEDYKELLMAMIKNDHVQITDEKGLIIGMKGENIISSFKFYAVFTDTDDYTVRYESEEIGTIPMAPPVGDRFGLAGRVWEVEETDVGRKLIYVKLVEGKMEIAWPGDYGTVHTKIMQRIRQVLAEDKVYPYLKKSAQKRLAFAREVAANSGMLQYSLLSMGGFNYVMFPWLGTISFRTLRRLMGRVTSRFKLSNMQFENSNYLSFRMEKGSEYDLIKALNEEAHREGLTTLDLMGGTELPIGEKYDEFIPGDLLRKAYAADSLSLEEVPVRVAEILTEF